MPPKKTSTSSSAKKPKPDQAGSAMGSTVERTMTKEEEEEMSSALIAQLLAQEGGDQHGYYAEYNNDASYSSLGARELSDDDEDYRYDNDYRPKSGSKQRSKSRKAAAPAKKRAKITPPTASKPTTVTTSTSLKAAESPVAETVVPDSATSKSTPPTVLTVAAAQSPVSDLKIAEATKPDSTTTSKAPDSPVKDKKTKDVPLGMNTGVYSDVEEKAFVEALELFGRSWRNVEEHVGTRDANSIRSHAQKHFIKLFRDNIPLPAKVLESGPGYTLSGRDLDPYSAAAKPYLAQRLLDDPSLLPVQSGQTFSAPDPSKPKSESSNPAKDKKAAPAPKPAKEKTSQEPTTESKSSGQKASKPAKEFKRASGTDSPPNEAAFAPVGRTDYSKARLRTARDRSSINFRQMASDLDPLTMVKCEPFCGQPNSGVVGCQPFGIKVQSNVLLGMDFHAHLMTTEIIGFLAGEWNPSTRMIHIQAIFPCRSLPTGQNHVNVEMDPTSEFEVRQEIEKRQMRIVGWYHSHPTFTPDPSLVDIENQTSYQNLFKDETMNEEPFVGAIVGPYDERLPGLSSVINWFYISQSAQERGHPKRLLYDLVEDTQLPEEESALWMRLFDEYRDSPERTNFQEQWRQEEAETKLQKMLVSLGRRMPWLRENLLKTMDSSMAADVESQVEPVEPAEQKVDGAVGQIPEGEPSPMETDSQMMEGVETGVSCCPSREESPSIGSGKAAGLGGLIKDTFLMAVEQELASWEPFAG